MACFVKLIPFIFHFAAGVYGKDGCDLGLPLDEQFRIACKRGWSNDPDDPGGATMVDVTIGAYADFRRSKGLGLPGENDLRQIAFDEWREILKTMYWDTWNADYIESQGLANLLVDWVWASVPKSIKRAQKVIGVKADGIVGDKTLSAVNGKDPEMLFSMIRNARESHYRSCRGAWKYLRGWLRRLDAIRPDGTFVIYGRTIGG